MTIANGKPRSRPARLDWSGAIAFTATLALFIYGMLLVPERGWSNGIVPCAVFPLEDAAAAHRALEAGETSGSPLLDLL